MRDLIKDLVKYLPAQIVPAIVGLATIIVVTRLFPPGDYGNYVLVMATATVVSMIAAVWLSGSLIRFFAAYELNNRLAEFYSLLLKLAVISVTTVSVIFLIVLFLAQGHISATLYSLMCIGLLISVATSFFTVLLSLFRAKRQVSWYSLSTIWKSIAGLGLGILLVLVFHLGVEGLLWGILLSTVIALPFLAKFSLGKLSLNQGQVRSSMTWELAKYGMPLMLLNLSSWALGLSDRYILQFFRGSAEVGVYSASYAISEQSITLIVSLFALSSLPIGYEIWERRGEEASRDFVQKLTRYYLLLGLPAVVGLSTLARPIVDVFVAPEYFPGYTIMPLVALGVFLFGIGGRFAIGLGFHKRPDLLLFCFLGSALLNIGLNFLLIPTYGYMAAAATTLVSYAFYLLLVILVSRRFFVWDFPYKSLAKAAAASAIMGAVVYPIGNALPSTALVNLIVAIVVGLVVYALTLFLLREPQKEEIEALRALKVRILGR